MRASVFHGMKGPDAARAIEKYRRHAAGYDATAARTMALRRRTIDLLDLRPGDVVLDVACGTGLSFPLLRDRVGNGGKVIGVELSPEMLAQARRRVETNGWTNVALVESAMEHAVIPATLDAVLFNYTHDVLRSPAALERIFAHTRPGARVAVAGVKHPPWWLFPARLWRLANASPYLTTFEGLDRPWSLLERYVTGLTITTVMLGTNYICAARVPGSAA
jgi:ubiquinone/menaquinone biosynthesis C-methylase UbiE